MVVNNLALFGGLEEFAKNLAVGIKRQGHEVSVLSTVWGPADNQYLRGLRKNDVTFVQLPKWFSISATEWPWKNRILSFALWVTTPIVYILSFIISLIRKQPWEKSLTSGRNWQREQFINRFEPNHRQPFVRLLLNWFAFRWRPDLIHIQGYTSDLLFVIDWAYEKKIPVVYEEHQTPDPQFDWWKDFKKSINKAAMVIAVSEKSAQGLREVCGVTQPIEVAYYMVPDPVEDGWVTVDRPVKNNRPIMVTTNARLYVTKGLPYLLEAIAQVKTIHPATQFRIYGDGPLRDDLLAYAAKLGLDGEEIFVGPYTSREELTNIMAHTDIFVLSSILEGLPIALLEAMSYGCPVVVTPVGGIPEAIEDGVNGLLCPPRDPQCLAEKICTLIENPDLRFKLGCSARKAYEQGPFNPTAVCRQYISIYRKILTAGTR